MTAAVVIGLGNVFRRDDGIGPAVAAAVDAIGMPGVRVVCPAETTAILDAWAGARLAVVVDAVIGGTPGRVRRCALDDLVEDAPVSSHELGLRQTYELGRALGGSPESLVVVTVDADDTDHGEGLSPAVAAALPKAVGVVLRILVEQGEETANQQP